MSKEYNTDEFYVGTLIIVIKTHDAIAKLKDALAKNQCSIAGVKAVVLQYKNANEQSMIELAAFLEANPKITSCYYETDRVDLFAELVLQTNTTIEELRFSKGSSVNVDDAEVLSKALQHNKTLQLIDFEGVKIEDQGLSKVFQGLKENATVTSLSVEGKIQQSAVDALSTVLQDNSSLTKLSLRNCQITDDLLFSLVDNGLKKNSTIESLLFIHNKISAVGAEKLAEFLQGNNILKRFFISSNQIGDDGVIAIARELKGNNTLQELGLRGNKIGYKGIAALSEALQGNNILENLDLGYNNVDDQAVEVLVHKLLSGNVTLQSLSIKPSSSMPSISADTINLFLKVLPNTGIYHLSFLGSYNREINDILKLNRQKLDAQKEAAEKAETPANILDDAGDGSPTAVGANDMAAEVGSDQVDLTGGQHPLGEF